MFAPPLERFVAWAERNHRALLALIIGIEIVVGVVYAVRLGDDLRYWDEREYMQLATSLLDRHEFRFGTDRAFRPPLYPLVLAAARWAGATVFGLRLLNFGFLAVSILLLARITNSYARPAAGLVAASLVLVNPVMIYTAGTLYPQTLAGCLLLAFVALVLRQPRRSLFAAGLVFALLVLTVPSFAPLSGIALLWLWRFEKRNVFRAALELCLGAALPIASWTLRNHHVLGAWVFTSTNSGMNLLYGNCENATPTSGVTADISRYVNLAAGLGEVERNRYYRDVAVQWIVANPAKAALLYVGKLLHYFSSNDRLATVTEASVGRMVIATIAYVPLQLGLLARLVLARRYPLERVELLLVSMVFANALVAAVFFTRVRLRLPADFLVIVLLGGLVGLLLRRVPAKTALDPPGKTSPR